MRFQWAVAVTLVVAQCGGSSLKREEAGDGDGSAEGGASGSTGARGGTTGNAGAGATNPTGGRGGSGATTAGGGRVSGGSGGSSAGGAGDGGNGAVSGAAGSDGGAAGEPGCTPFLVSPSDCSREDTCRVLECGAPWSLYDAQGCDRTECTETGTCPAGERCVPAPVLGKYDDPCFYHPDSCSIDEDECFCSVWEECIPLAVCLPIAEFPPERDCPIDDPMDCLALAQAVETLEAYRDGTPFIFFPYEPPPALAESVESCAMRLAGALQAECD